MLKKLFIKNFAIIDQLEFDFQEGFNVFTGETGAGKSIIIEAITYLLGKSFNEEVIKNNQENTIIEGILQIPDQCLTAQYQEYLEPDSQELIVLRKLSRKSGSTAKINNQTVSLKKLKELVTPLINIIGQHGYLTLVNSNQQLALLDEFAGKHIEFVKNSYKENFYKYQKLKQLLQKMEAAKLELVQKKEFLTFQIQDIEQYSFDAEEEELLNSQKKQLNDLEESKKSLKNLTNSFEAIQKNLFNSTQELETKTEQPLFSVMNKSLAEFSILIEDYLEQIKKRAQELEYLDTLDLNEIEARLHTIFTTRRKYHAQNLQELLAKLADLKKQLAELNNLVENSETMQLDYLNQEQQIYKLADQLHEIRITSAKKFTDLLLCQMADLALEKAQFKISIKAQPDKLSENGYDLVQFLVSTNQGQACQALDKVASGGELSRIMLAIKTILIEGNNPTTYIFDEIDTGVGGLTAIKVGEKLKKISDQTQVFCVTHLPQIAKFANHHYMITKKSKFDMTITQVVKLNDITSKQELKRMLGGEEVLKVL